MIGRNYSEIGRDKTRSRVFRNENKIKESITESLTKMRMEALKRALGEFEFHNIWTCDGNLMYKELNDTKIQVGLENKL